MGNIRHMAVIMDGNRRFAKANNLMPWQGHKKGGQKLKDFLKWCDELGVKEITLYAFSMQNFNRTKEEIEYLFDLFNNYLDEIFNSKELIEKKVRINFIGRINLFPEEIRSKMIRLMDVTKNFSDRIINVAMAYGGRTEIIDAVNKIIDESKSQHITEDEFSKYLYMSSEPDIIIRTGNVVRTSNFLPWQAIYSEWFFLDKMWPEITKDDLLNIINKFNSRERRFGR